MLSSTALNKLTRAEVISKFRVNKSDVGSSEVQIALITQRLARLALHFRKHDKDIHSQRGMHAMINRRKKLLAYLKSQSLERYNKVLASLGLRK
ncbi:MAG TPA: 30S ribosomal protein S15 [Oligoflexia bacterium]|nr:30S ribosomal protein S15 [Oligoflexia bacterium]HMP26462.1 30S ribosomal protein S15 [Oligoflexia bacterium]